MSKNLPAVVEHSGGTAVVERAVGGGLEGAERLSRETLLWSPPTISADRQINSVKEMADARGRDMVQNDGYAIGAVQTHKDSIVGAQFRLNLHPDWELLKRLYPRAAFDEEWADEFQQVVESRFNLLSDSPECWFDAERKKTLTDMIRLDVGAFCFTGESLATVEWIRQSDRPFYTAIQAISPSRLSNPFGEPDTPFLKRGINKDQYGAPVSYFIRVAHPGDVFDPRYLEWKEVPAKKPWGRVQVIHIYEPLQVGQSRGVSEMVSVLKSMRMTRKFADVTLQNAVVNASYAAAVESELPSEMVYRALGAGGTGLNSVLGEYLTSLNEYLGTAQNINVDGAKIPHLFPGTKLSLKPMGTPGGVGTEFEHSLLRHTAAALGLSYEQFSRDYTKTNYSSARASMAETFKFMQSRKRGVADKKASAIMRLWMEEELNAGALPLPKGADANIFYDAVAREALCNCTWIGASRGQIDEKKETESAILRIKSGLSTYEKECALLGDDFRKIFAQRAREDKLLKKLGLEFNLESSAPKADATGSAGSADKRPGDPNQDDEL